MNSNEYRAQVLTTEAKPEALNIRDAQLVALMGVAVAVGNVVDQMKKVIFYGREPNRSQLFHSMGSLLGYAQMAAIELSSIEDTEGGQRMIAENSFSKDLINKRLLHSAMGKFGESAELIGALTAQGFGEQLDVLNFLEELGDSDWYGPIALDELGVSEECVRTMNVAKLTLVRYASKRFTGDEAANRKKELEREAMQFVLDWFATHGEGKSHQCLSALANKLGVAAPVIAIDAQDIYRSRMNADAAPDVTD